MVKINKSVLSSLDFNKVLYKLKSLAMSPSASEKIENIQFFNTVEDIENVLDETNEAYKVLYEYSIYPDFSFDNIDSVIQDATKGIILSLSDILKVKRLMTTSRLIKGSLNSILDNQIVILKDYVFTIFEDKEFEDYLDKNILSDTEIADSASLKLRDIRKKIRLINEKIRQKINSYMSKSSYSQFMQDNLYTIRSDRYVIPVKSEYRSNVKGILHDQSTSGATVFIEPYEIVEMNNELAFAFSEEKEEIYEILKNITTKIVYIKDELIQNKEVVVNLDIIFSKAKLSKTFNGVRPELSNIFFNIIDGRHPLLDVKKVVPVSVGLNKKQTMLIITGSNTGGKTVSLKMIGLFTLMSMIGLYIPAKEGSILQVFDHVYSDIGDEQSIEQSLSTFSSHIKRIIDILNNANNNSLVLLDELAMGTDPSEGSALAVSICKYLLDKSITSIVTTHYHELKEFALSQEKAQIAAMDFDVDTYEPTYKLLVGLIGTSNALNIAKRLGINEDIINDAKSLLKDDFKTFNKIMNYTDARRREIDLIKEDLDKERELIKADRDDLNKKIKEINKEKEEIAKKAKLESKRLIDSYKQEAQDIIDEIKDLTSQNNKRNQFKIFSLNKKLQDIEYENQESEFEYEKDNTPFAVGDSVYVASLSSVAIINKVNFKKQELEILCGQVESKINFKDCYKIKANKELLKKKPKQTVQYKKNINPVNANSITYEINLLGKNVDEARHALDEYFDNVMLVGLKTVSVIHGKGTGVLRKGVHEYLKENPHVKSFRLGKYGEGDTGVTIVELK